MYKDAMRAAWAEINITNLDYNIKQIREKAGPGKKSPGSSKQMPMVTELLKLPLY